MLNKDHTTGCLAAYFIHMDVVGKSSWHAK